MPSNSAVQEISPYVFRLTRLAARIFLFPFFRIRTQGLFQLPEKGSFLLLPKHQRWEDVPLLGMAVPRPMFFVAKQELFQSAFSRWFIGSLGGIPLNRKRPLESRPSIRAVRDLLEKGEGVVIFPEGTYFPGKMGPGHIGLIRMICSRIAVPCIPVGVRYFESRLPKTVQISFGEPALGALERTGPEFYHNLLSSIAGLSGLDTRFVPPADLTGVAKKGE